MGKFALLLSVALSLGLAPAPLKAIKPPEREKLQGEWHLDGGTTTVLAIASSSMTYLNLGRATNAYVLACDAKKSPKTYDVSRGGHLAFVGAYKIEGDTLTICYRSAGGPRPVSFDERGPFREVFKRKKP